MAESNSLNHIDHSGDAKDIYSAFLHAEVVGQARLNNFLMTGTIVLVGCAIALQYADNVTGAIVSLALATLGILFSRIWYFLGCRQRMYHHFIEWHMENVTENSPSSGAVAILSRIREFHTVLVKENEGVHTYDYFNPERAYSSRKLLTSVPRYFIGTYVVFWFISLAMLFQNLIAIDGKLSIILGTVSIVLITKLIYIYRKDVGLFCRDTSNDEIRVKVKTIMDTSSKYSKAEDRSKGQCPAVD